VVFGARENSFSVDGPSARRNLPTANSGLFDFHQEALEQTIVELDDSDVVGRVRQAIQQLLPSAGVTEERVASVVDLNVRTLHRRLSREGQNYRALLQEVRMALAQRYMAQQTYTITEVAFMLGYSDASAFSRAFKGWYGDTPSSYRLKET
jgi:AraC-like DNA-binding protein